MKKHFLIPLFLSAICLSAGPASAAILTVNSNGDAADANLADGICDTGFVVGSVPECTLRAALLEANVTTAGDTIQLDPTTPTDVDGFIRITPATPFPTIQRSVFLDGQSAPGYDSSTPFATPVVQLSGALLSGPNDHGFAISGLNATNSVIRGFAVHGFPSDGIGVFNTNGVQVTRCHVGIRDGSIADGNGGAGVRYTNVDGGEIGPRLLLIGGFFGFGNVIGSNGGDGVSIDGSNVQVSKNRIGTDPTGQFEMGNSGHGVSIEGGSANEVGGFGTDFQGSPQVGGNLISGNVSGGVSIADGVADTLVYGNIIGANAEATAPVPNLENGIHDIGDRTLIGDVEPVFENILSGNTRAGVLLGQGFPGNSAEDGEIVGNTIGLRGDKSGPLGNGSDGIRLLGTNAQFISDNLIGGNAESGIDASAGTGTVLLRNRIGTNDQGEDLGNGADGIRAYDGWEIGGIAPGEGNTIAFNGVAGVRVLSFSSTNVTIRGNSMFDNGGLGIDLFSLGRTPNDIGDPDVGANDFQNFPGFDPQFTRYNEILDQFEFRYRVDTNLGEAIYPLAIDFYLADAGGTNGRTWIGEDLYPSISAGSFRSIALPRPAGVIVLVGAQVVAAATDDGGTNNTSEISDPVPVPEPGRLALFAGTLLIGGLAAKRAV